MKTNTIYPFSRTVIVAPETSFNARSSRVLPESHASKRQKKTKKKVNLKESGEGAAKLHVVS